MDEMIGIMTKPDVEVGAPPKKVYNDISAP